MDRIKVRKSQVKPILAASFPGYRGRTFYIEFRASVTYHNTNWGGGTRSQYCAVGINAAGKVASRHLHVDAPWNNPVEGSTAEVPPNVVLVRHSIFCGTDMGITIYANPIHAPRWLPA